MAWFEVDDPTGRDEASLFEIIADDIGNIQSRVHGVHADNVRVGKVMMMEEALEDIKRQIEGDTSDLGAIPGDHDYTEPS